MTGNEVLAYLLAVLSGLALIIFYYTIIKWNQDEKKESQRKGKEDIVSVEPDPYEGIIDEYPTYNRQK